MASPSLAGMRVIEVGDDLSGAICGRYLAGFGADVVVIEPPGIGCAARHLPPFLNGVPGPERSGMQAFVGQGKRSVSLALTEARGRKLLRTLLATADVVVETLGLEGLERLGTPPELLLTGNPGTVITRISPYGLDGPYARRIASQLTLAADSGWLFQLGEPGKPPVLTSNELLLPGVVGLYAAVGTLAALIGNSINGTGEIVEISGMECLLAANRYYETTLAQRGEEIGRRGSETGTAMRFVRCSDGEAFLSASTSAQRELMALLIGLTDLLDDPLFTSSDGQYRHSATVERAVDDWLAQRSREECFHLAQQYRVPFGMVRNPEELLDLEQLQARGFFAEVNSSTLGTLPMPTAPFTSTESSWRVSASPRLGDANVELLCDELGLSRAELSRLTADGVI